MKVKNVIDEDVVNYRKTCMFIGTCFCDWKCCTEIGADICLCQNSKAYGTKIKDVDDDRLVKRYLKNGMTHALVLGGFEPFWKNTWGETLAFLRKFRESTQDDIVIYTGYREGEIDEQIEQLRPLGNVIVKFGRYRPGEKPHRDEVLGVELANDEQHAVRIS